MDQIMEIVMIREYFDKLPKRIIEQKSLTILDLPRDILIYNIFSLLNLADLNSIQKSCKHFYQLAQTESLWNNHLKNYVGNVNFYNIYRIRQ